MSNSAKSTDKTPESGVLSYKTADAATTAPQAVPQKAATRVAIIMSDIFSRETLLIGKDGVSLLTTKTVAVFGIGGVGSFAAEALARAGIGHLVLVDNDVVSVSNINRQLIALSSTVGQPKTDVMRTRIRDINPRARVTVHRLFFGSETLAEIDFSSLDYIIDAIDTVSSKLLLIEQARAHDVPIISCMGTGNKLDPTRFEVADIYQTSVCPLARVMRHELKKRGIPSLQVVYSREEPHSIAQPVTESERHLFAAHTVDKSEQSAPPEIAPITEKSTTDDTLNHAPTGKQTRAHTKPIPASISFVPPVAGLIAASVAVRALLGIKSA